MRFSAAPTVESIGIEIRSATRNIRDVSLHTVANNDLRPVQFKQETYQETTSAENHMLG